MKLRSVLRNAVKIVLWIIFFVLLGLFFLGYAKHEWGFKDYFSYLNDKDWRDSVERVHLFQPSSYGSLFWDAQSSGAIVVSGSLVGSGYEVQEFPIDGMTWVEEDVDVFDPEFQDEFEEFFAEDDLENDDMLDEGDLNSVTEDEWFVGGFHAEPTSGTTSSVVDQDVIVDEATGEVELSQNKQDLLKKLNE